MGQRRYVVLRKFGGQNHTLYKLGQVLDCSRWAPQDIARLVRGGYIIMLRDYEPETAETPEPVEKG